jgi:hypothetical protein
MSKFEHQCGFTRQVCTNLFHPINKGRRRRCEDYGVTFVQADQDYEVKQIRVQYKTYRQSFAALYPTTSSEMPNRADASTGTDPPAVPAAPATEPENVLLAHGLQVVSVDKNKIVTKSGNNKLQEWHRIVAATEENGDFERFRHALTSAHMKEILLRLTGDTDIGVTLLVQLLYNINADACKLGMKRCGAGVFKKLTPEQTVALTIGAGITARARIYINRFFSYHNDGSPMVACEADCAAVKFEHEMAATCSYPPYPLRGICCRPCI